MIGRLKKGCKYGTVIVDLETHRVIDLLPDREAKTLSTWAFRASKHWNCQQGSFKYVRRCHYEACPQTEQIADRWHILKNLSETVERFLDTQRVEIKETALKLSQQQQQKSVNRRLLLISRKLFLQNLFYKNLFLSESIRITFWKSKNYNRRDIVLER